MRLTRITFVPVLLSFAAVACPAEPAVAPELSPDTTQARRYVVPRTIDASGAADVTGALTAFFSSVPDVSTIHFPQGAIYRVEGTLLFSNRNNLRLEGHGATIIARTDGSGVTPPLSLRHLWPRGRKHLMFSGGSDITVRRLTVVGANANAGTASQAFVVALEAQHAFEFSGVTGVLLDSVRATDVYGDFVYLGAGSAGWTSNVVVRNSHFDRNGRQGIGVTGARDVLFEGNYIGNVRRTSIDIEPNTTSGGAQHITFRNNTFGPTRLNFLSSIGKASLVDDITIEGNTLIGHSLKINVTPPAGSRRSRFRILNNTSDAGFGSPQPLMRFTRIDSLEVRGNVQALSAGRNMTGVQTFESCAVVVTGNQFRNAIAESNIQPTVCP